MARHSLKPEDFVEAGLRVVERGGASALTARNLADELGVDPSALYRHFDGLDTLGSAILNHVLGSIDVDDLGGGTPRERLERLADRVHAKFVECPNVAALTLVNSTPMPDAERISQALVFLLEEFGLEGADLVACNQMLETAMIGSHVFDLAGAPDHLEIRRLRWRRMEHPALDERSLSADGVAEANERAYRMMMESLLDRCETVAAASASQSRLRRQA